MQPSWEVAAQILTQQAVQAAEEGRWDTVGVCYQRRAELFQANDVSGSLAGALRALDQTVHERLRIATMTVQHLMTEAAAKQRCIERFGTESDVPQMRSRRVNRLA